MTTTRPAIPVTNLKERIAALEQRNAGNGASRPTSPTAGAAPIISSVAPAAPGFRDKIAKFERKGGVPVPRGSFGLGAPPVAGGPRRQGELYGNRIPAPARSVSVGMLPISRAGSPVGSFVTDSPESSPGAGAGDRRSFSLSSVISDLDDQRDYTPISSPTFAFPLDSPESLASVSFTPEASPSLTSNGDVASFAKPILRGTSFQKALEIARNAEIAKTEAQGPVTPIPRQRSIDNQEEDEVESPEPTPVIVVSSEDTPPVILHDSPRLESDSLPIAASPSETSAPTFTPISAPEPEASSETKYQTSEPDTHAEIHEESPVGQVPVIEVTPLTIKKRKPTDPIPAPVEEKIAEVAEATQAIPSEAAPKAEEEASGPHPDDDKPSTQLTFVVHAPSPTEPSHVEVASEETHKPISAEISGSEVPIVQVSPPIELPIETATAIVQPQTKTVRRLPEVPSPPQIVVHNDYTSTQQAEVIKPSSTDSNKNEEFSSRKAALTLDSQALNDDTLMSPPLVSGNMSAMSLTDVLSNYFTSEKANRESTFRTATPPPRPGASPLSPFATLAYDGPESPPNPTIQVPDPQSFLSPPPLSAAPSSGGSSMGSMSSLGSRPMSMIETSPSRVARAMRMTPATSRGVPMFLPPSSARPRKSDFVYFPPTPDAEDTEFGSATLHKSSHSLSSADPRNRRSEPDLTDPSTSRSTMFRAVVHGKVKETPMSATVPVNRQRHVPETPQTRRVKRDTVLEPPLSPGQGELAALLQEAVLLEDSLDRGELPTEMAVQEERERKEQEVVAAAAAEAKAAKAKEDAERKRIALATAQLQAKRDEPTAGRLKHTFLIPLSKARSVHRKEVSTSHSERFPNKPEGDPVVHPKSAGAPTAKAEFPQSNQLRRPVTPENSTQEVEAPSKSPKPSRFSSFRRLGSMSRPNTIHGGSARHSNSTSSEFSEDSVPVVTPPEGSLEFTTAKMSPVSEFGHMANGSTTSFPSLSPKKSIHSIGRATSFAEKMWSRARTRSNGSNLSATSEMTDRILEDVPTLPPIGPPPALQLPLLPQQEDTRLLNPPRRSASLKRSVNLPAIPTEAVPPLPAITSTSFFQTNAAHASDISSDSFLLPGSTDSTRPSSWTSMSSAGSLPSPLFDKALFDAFPSVPGTVPLPSFTSVHNMTSRPVDTSNMLPVVIERPSFDSALLSSAIHLVSTHKSASTPVPQTTLNSSRAPTPTPMPRRSGEMAR
ncbi:hypothetical protein BDZ97DRAFT_207974 [Flammula alnicola]|nr:hypothetical protein BDZ97DRAFT_207974 [Flammula alnicola]